MISESADVEITKTTSLLNVGYKGEEVDRIIELVGKRIVECTKEIRNIDLTLHNDVLLKQYDVHYISVLKKQRNQFIVDRKFWKCLTNKLTGEECYKRDELKDE